MTKLSSALGEKRFLNSVGGWSDAKQQSDARALVYNKLMTSCEPHGSIRQWLLTRTLSSKANKQLPFQSPIRASCLLMTMSISLAPSATASLISSNLVLSGVWPAGNPVATEIIDLTSGKHIREMNTPLTPNLYMSRDARKPVFGISDQVRHKPGCTSSEAG